MRSHNDKLIPAVGALYIIFGILLVGASILSGLPPSALHFIVRGAAVLLGGATLAAGLMLWRGNPDGGIIAAFVTALQVPIIATPSVFYHFVAGPFFNLLVGTNGAQTQFGASMDLTLGRASADSYTFGINVVALSLLIWFVSYVKSQSSVDESPESARADSPV